MKKYLSVLLALFLMLSLCACGGKNSGKGKQEKAASVAPEDLYEWQEISGGVEITKYLGSETKIVVPSVLANKAVVSVGTAFSGNVTLKDLELPDTVTKADLTNCKELKRLVVDGNIKYVGTASISGIRLTGCTALEYIKLSKATEVYLDQEQLRSVRELVLPSLKSAIGLPQSLEKLDVSGAQTIHRMQLPNLKEVTIGKDVQWYIYNVNDEGTETGIYSVCKEKPGDYYDGARVYSREITEENKARVYCELFGNDEIIVNGVKYTYKK